MADTDTFTYVKIPATTGAPIEELTASKAGGLERDELVANAKQYFRDQQPASQRPDNPVLSPSCDIMALTIPMAGNGFTAVSLYASDTGVDATVNERATALVTACGHNLPDKIRGDVFVGRAEDNEVADVWERRDFTSSDADPTAEWCRTARSAGGGGGHGTASASSLSGILQQQFSKNATAIQQATPVSQGMYGMNGTAAVEEPWGGKWTQNREEVELKVTIPSNVKPKIVFKRNQLSVVVGDKETKGALFGVIVPDECTYTIEAMGNDEKEVCITLTKAEEGSTWSWLLKTD
ncbi:MAG: hypothetical protein SGILL_006782 [Bacillariaceae sp.]